MKLIFIVLRVIVFILFSTTYFYIIPGEITWDAGLSSLQSIRETQEDYASFMAFEYLEKPGLIATVFDGHGGDAVSKQGNEFFCNRYIEKLKKVVASEPNEPLQLVLQKTFSSYSKHLNRDCRDYLKVGSTCIAAVIYDGRCYFGNLGDSRGFLKTKEHFFCTNDHKYTNDTEKPYCEKVLPNDQKVIDAFGRAITAMTSGIRHSYIPNVSRAFGDYFCKTYFKKKEQKYQFFNNPVIRDEPDIFVHDIDEDSYVIIASDGFWDVVKSEDVDGLIGQYLKNCSNHNDLAHALANYAVKNECSSDNTTVVFIAPKHFFKEESEKFKEEPEELKEKSEEFKEEPEEFKEESEELRCSDNPRDLGIIEYGMIAFVVLYGLFLLKSAYN